eukprot:509031-Pyramimonas_sp.AAC.1
MCPSKWPCCDVSACNPPPLAVSGAFFHEFERERANRMIEGWSQPSLLKTTPRTSRRLPVSPAARDYTWQFRQHTGGSTLLCWLSAQGGERLHFGFRVLGF